MRKQFNIATGTVTEHENAPVTWEVPTPTYSELRAEAYPPMANYLDGIVKGDDAQVQKYIDDCLAVKAKYPKADEETE